MLALILIAGGVAITYLLLVVLPWKATLDNYAKLVQDYHKDPQVCIDRSRKMKHYARGRALTRKRS